MDPLIEENVVDIKNLIASLEEAEVKSDTQAIADMLDTNYRCWNAQSPGTSPENKPQQVKRFIEFFAKSKVTAIKINVEFVDVVGDAGVVYTRYQETIRDGSGADKTYRGYWVMTVVKREKGWRFLNWSFAVIGDS